jgi:hypothetical protein
MASPPEAEEAVLGPLPALPPRPVLLTHVQHVEQLVQKLQHHISTSHHQPWPPLVALTARPVELGSLPSGKRAVLLVLVWRDQATSSMPLGSNQGGTDPVEQEDIMHRRGCSMHEKDS